MCFNTKKNALVTPGPYQIRRIHLRSTFLIDEEPVSPDLDIVELGNRFTDYFISTTENVSMILALLDVSFM